METCENCKMNRLCKELDAVGYTRICSTLHPISKTNADKIRQMSDEELAGLFVDTCACLDDDVDVCEKWNGACDKCWLDWLKQEVPHDQAQA